MPSDKRRVGHKQVPARVIAYVDEGIKELVELLNTFENIATFESCESRQGKMAFVYMEYGGTNIEYNDSQFIEMALFVHRLAMCFARYIKGQIGGGYLANISVEWWGDKKSPFISIEMPPDCISEVTNVLHYVQTELKNNR